MLEALANIPLVLQIFTIMGAARAIFKPLCAGINKYVEESESMKDNELWEKIKTHKAFKIASYVLDLSLSIKMPK